MSTRNLLTVCLTSMLPKANATQASQDVEQDNANFHVLFVTIIQAKRSIIYVLKC